MFTQEIMPHRQVVGLISLPAGAALATKAGMGQAGTGYPGGSVSRYTFADVPSVTSYKMAAGSQYTLLNRGGWWNAANSTSPAGDNKLS